MNTCDSDPTLRPTPVVDADHPAVLAFTHHAISGVTGTREQAVALYYAVRDGIRYDPYHIHLTVAGTCASGVLAAGRGWCVNKAALLAACCRAAGIPARLGYADVRNHLSTERLRRNLGTDTFYWHGYTVILIDGRWVKATPAFNVELCEKFRLATLEFNGHEDSLYHPFDLDGRRHMEYLRYHDEYDDVPLDAIRADFDRHYPNAAQLLYADFDADVSRETAR
ncbi:MAG: transglutaminase family protein [Nevskiaceae bacterium]|nr:MAG: transglutaminase family protein [Nevskiaceae bacterium]TBR73947.1 MAG: transglutaminase family protein [Nevskiaceae bacterium]